MARFEIADLDVASLGAGSLGAGSLGAGSLGAGSLGQAPVGADAFYQLGMMYSVGNSVPTDFVVAHKWFNIAAMKGNKDAIRLRQEIAQNMSPAEIAAAQRAARAWLSTTH